MAVKTPLLNLRVSDEDKARWLEAATRQKTSLSEFIRHAVEMELARGVEVPPPVTKSGRVLTDEDIQALADEAEKGYDVLSPTRTLSPRRFGGPDPKGGR